MKKGIHTEYITLVNMNAWFGMDARGYLRFGEFESRVRRRARRNKKIYRLIAFVKKITRIYDYPLNRLEAQFDAETARRIGFMFLSYQFEPNMV